MDVEAQAVSTEDVSEIDTQESLQYQQSVQHLREEEGDRDLRKTSDGNSPEEEKELEADEETRSSTPYHIVEILLNSSGRAVMPGISVSEDN